MEEDGSTSVYMQQNHSCGKKRQKKRGGGGGGGFISHWTKSENKHPEGRILIVQHN